jgi:hypothetical protein
LFCLRRSYIEFSVFGEHVIEGLGHEPVQGVVVLHSEALDCVKILVPGTGIEPARTLPSEEF